MFTRNVILLFLYFHLNKIEAAVPLDIVTEKTNEERLLQSFPYIIPMIPDKEPLITAVRKQNTDEKDLINSQMKFLDSLAHKNTSDSEEQRNITKDETSITLEQKAPQEQENKSENVTVVVDEPKTNLNASWEKISRKERLFLQRTKTSKIPQRRKRSLIEYFQKIEPIKPQLHKTLDPMIISEQDTRLPDQDNFLQKIEQTDAEEMSEVNILRKRKETWDPYYIVYTYDSEYVDYNVPFPYYKRPRSKPVSVAHGAEVATAQLYPILKSMLLGRSSLTGRRFNNKRRPGWKKPW